MRTAIVGAVLLGAGGVAVACGALPMADVLRLWQRVWPILLFVLAATVVTQLAAEAGVFTAGAQQAARWGMGRAWLLWLLVVAVSAASTIFLSIDTTAVLLTPVVIILAKHAGLSPMPFALTTVWMANAGSLLLPVSNLTNLLAQHAMGQPSPAAFAALTVPAAVVAVIVPMITVFVVSRRSLLRRYQPVARGRIRNPRLLWSSSVVVVALIPLLVSGMPVWIPTCAAAVVLLAVFLVLKRDAIRPRLVPWQLLLLACGLFLVIEVLQAHGLGTVLGRVAGSGESPLSLLRMSFTGLIAANGVNNLPAYLALEPIAGTPHRLVALLIGVNAGSLITPWASLATLLWHDQLAAFGVELRWNRYVLAGAIVAPVTVALATLAVSLTL